MAHSDAIGKANNVRRLVLAQIATDAKSNEITAVLKLLAMLSLSRRDRKGHCAAGSSQPAGTMPTSRVSWLYSEVRLP
jgi:hypothetical protein